MFRSQREPDPFVTVGGGEGSSRVAVHGPFRRFLSSFSCSSSLPFMISFLFIVEPESLVHNGPVRGMRASTRCLSPCPPPRLSRRPPRFLSSRFLPRRNEKRLVSQSGETDAGRNEKSTPRGMGGGPSSSRRSKSFFFFFFRTKYLSFDELASSDLFRPSRSMDRVVNRYS